MLTTCSYTTSSKKIIFSLFCESSLLDHIPWKVVLLKLLRKSKPGWFLLKSSEMFLLNLLKVTFGNFRVLEGNNDLYLMSQYRPCRPRKLHTVISFFFTTLRHICGNTTVLPKIIHIWRSLQRWRNTGATL